MSQEISVEEIEKLACNLANIFIVANNSKVPIKRADVAKNIPKEYSRRFNDILKEASTLLEKIFGYKIVELPTKRSYVLLNTMKMESELEEVIFESSPTIKEVAESTLRTNILIVIFMSGGIVQEGTIKEFLRKLGLDFESKIKHPILGDVHKLVLTDFVRQGYLEINEKKDLENSPKEYSWGCRAVYEYDKKKLIEFVAEVYGDNCQPDMFTEQWKQANNSNE